MGKSITPHVWAWSARPLPKRRPPRKASAFQSACGKLLCYNGRAMIRIAIILAAALTGSAALADDRLQTLERGSYACGVPGDAGSEAWVRDPRYAFTIRTASQYDSARGSGTYLLHGRELVFTRGPLKDMRFRIDGANVLRKTGGDGDPRMFCARAGR